MTKFLNISTDTTLGGGSASDSTVSSQKAIKAYVDSQTGTAPAFANITGQPTDNANLASALNAKYDASNPNGYTSNIGTVTSVNNTSPDSGGNVSLTIPTVDSALSTTSENAVQNKVITSALNGKANDNAVVKLTGNQTIGGVKTFSDNTIFTNAIGNLNNYVPETYQKILYLADGANSSGFKFGIYQWLDLLTVTARNSANSWIRDLWQCNANTGVTNFSQTPTAPAPSEDTTTSIQIDTVGARNTKLQNYQPALVSGTNIKTINNTSILGSGNIEVGGGSVDVDNKSITTNSSDEIQTVGVIDSNNTTNAIKTWTGTKAQYDAIVTKDPYTLYNVTDTGEIYLGSTILSNYGADTDLSNLTNTGESKFDNKANVDLSNVNASGTSIASGWSMPSSRYIDLTLGATPATYTAPANGYFAIASTFNQNGILFMYSNSPRYGNSYTYNQNAWTEGVLFVKKGYTVNIQYSGTPSLQYFRFIYAEGEN